MDVYANLNKFNEILFDFYFDKEHVAFPKTFDCIVLKKFTNVGKILFQPSVNKNSGVFIVNIKYFYILF